MKIITTAFPFVPAVLGIAHFASTYLPADIYYRSLKLMNEDCVFVNATDFHSIFATKNGEQDIEQCKSFHKSYLNAYKATNIQFNHIITTDSSNHIYNVMTTIENLKHNDLLYRKNTKVVFCENCKQYLPQRFIVSGDDGKEYCHLCNSSELISKDSEHIWLKVEKCKNLIHSYVEKFTQNEVKNIVLNFLKDLHDWDFTRG